MASSSMPEVLYDEADSRVRHELLDSYINEDGSLNWPVIIRYLDLIRSRKKIYSEIIPNTIKFENVDEKSLYLVILKEFYTALDEIYQKLSPALEILKTKSGENILDVFTKSEKVEILEEIGALLAIRGQFIDYERKYFEMFRRNAQQLNVQLNIEFDVLSDCFNMMSEVLDNLKKSDK